MELVLIMRKGHTVGTAGHFPLWEAPIVLLGTSSPLTEASPFMLDPTHWPSAHGLLMQRYKFLATLPQFGTTLRVISVSELLGDQLRPLLQPELQLNFSLCDYSFLQGLTSASPKTSYIEIS